MAGTTVAVMVPCMPGTNVLIAPEMVFVLPCLCGPSAQGGAGIESEDNREEE